MFKKYLLISLQLLISTLTIAQYYENGQDPFSIRWKQIQTPHFQVIFSDEVESTGKIYAAYLEKIHQTGGTTLNHNARKIPVIIHNHTTFSNGEVAWAPKRMNLYVVPPQQGYAEPYRKHLSLHEFRHVVQIDKLNQSSTKYLSYLFGEQAIGAVLGWHIPRWFFEGDAVSYETGASKSGRGSTPDFNMRLKAQVDKYGLYSYPKAQFGSFKNFVPNHYELGYQLIARSNIKYGSELWSSTLTQIAKSPIHPNAFSKGIKKYTGIPERVLYREIMNDYQQEGEQPIPIRQQGIRKLKYSNYLSPYQHNKGIICYKTSYDKTPKIIFMDNQGHEKKIINTGSILNETFSFNKKTIVWNEFRGTRWENKNYNRIVSFDLTTGKKQYLAKKTKAYQSRISPDNTKILSVETDEQLKWRITIRSAESGQLMESISFGNKQPIQASWSDDMSEIIFFQLNETGKSLGILHLENKQITWIIKDSFLDIKNPLLNTKNAYITGVYNNKSNILKYDRESKQWSAITNETYGVGEFRLSDDAYLFSSYTADGYKIKTIQAWKGEPINGSETYQSKLQKHLKKQEEWVDLNSIDTTFTIQKYSRLKHLINIHSWAPLGINIQNIEVGPGVTIMSQNALSTSTLVGGYLYNITDQSHKYYTDFTYKGFFPLLSIGFSSTYLNDSIKANDNSVHHMKWNETSAYSTLSLPFNMDRGLWYRRFQPSIQYSYTALNPSSDNPIQWNSSTTHRLYYTGYFSNTIQQSYRDLQSKWGQIVRVKYMHSPLDLKQYGQLASGEFFGYFPGLINHHGIRVYAGYQKKEYSEYGNYGFNDQLIYPYGYQKQYNTVMQTAHIYYTFPIIYPDLNLWQYVYIKRFKSEIFYQYASLTDDIIENEITSAGIDLTADMHIFRFVFPLELGVRYARKIQMNQNYYQFLINLKF